LWGFFYFQEPPFFHKLHQNNNTTMKKTLLIVFCFVLFGAFRTTAQTSVTVFNEILFYDGYASVVDFPTPDGVIRGRNDLYAKKLTDAQLQSFGNTMTINVTIKASCDNYDRIGNVNLAFVPKGAPYTVSGPIRIELGRFITPFMNKNIEPTQVPYTFTVDNVAQIFKDPSITANYDIWAELEVFGVPYAANTQVAGCAGRNDVFFGTLEFVSGPDTANAEHNYLLPLNFKKDLNNYTEGATDVIGQTVRTITFTLPEAVNDAKFHLITSNHGANSGGEEYRRRVHYVYLDGALKLTYTPGGISCEPYRMYNTQGNGIYEPNPRTDASWASNSNWCPGQVIPIREIVLGDLAAGTHTFKIDVPQARFVGQQGYIPVSLYLQGTSTTGSLQTANYDTVTYSIYPNPASDVVHVDSSEPIVSIKIYNLLGQEVARGTSETVNISQLQKGIYNISISTIGKTFVEKLLKN